MYLRGVQSGRVQNLPYSLSRWTDVPAAKWPWMEQQFRQGWMVGFDSSAVPEKWSLKPEDTLGLIWWTKNPTNLIGNSSLLKQYRQKIHVTVTGWEEVEKGAPSLKEGGQLLMRTAREFGHENVVWRFSPVPVVDDVVRRFNRLLPYAEHAGLREVFVSFLQPNDLVPETRTDEQRLDVLAQMTERAAWYNLQVRLCNEERLDLSPFIGLQKGVCAPPEAFNLPGVEATPSEGCGCGMAVDPFTINESCTFGCRYCYAADQTLSDKKRNTTRLPVVR